MGHHRLLTIAATATLVATTFATESSGGAAVAAPAPARLTCSNGRLLCTEVYDSEAVFGEDVYVGHDEPSVLFYSQRPGSGNRMQYQLKIPSDPAGPYRPSKSYNVMLHPAFWFGMAMCDTQSYPEQVSTCTPDSDTNIVDPAVSPNHPGTAFTELQFYPPGYVQQFDGFSCDATKWCVALTIDSLSIDPVNGTQLNDTCPGLVGGPEPVNFAYLTRNGRPQGPPDPLNFDPVASGKPGRGVLYLNQGDNVVVTMRDTPHGLMTEVDDTTTGQRGFMTASAANGFAQVNYAPSGTDCSVTPYDFHPMYSTSSPATRVPWAAHSYNVAFSDEIGHFDFCTRVDPATGSCSGREGAPGDREAADGDDNGCFTPADSLALPLTGCFDTNTGFDGSSYQNIWPDGSSNHPTPITFSSPLTGNGFHQNYEQVAFEADLPRVELATCDRTTGTGCTLIPTTDDGVPADFYPYFSTLQGHNCRWAEGAALPNSRSDFGKNNQYGALVALVYTSGAGTVTRFNDFRNILPNNPCQSGN
ncbi:MAG: hypothetical protein ACXV8L_00800 [Ilumatobacteraceae bacterium]